MKYKYDRLLFATTLAFYVMVFFNGCSLEPIDLNSFLTGGSSGEPEPPPPAERLDAGWAAPERKEVLDVPPPIQGCRDLDILFVVDNSGSMEEDQAQLQAAAPLLLEQLQDFDIGFDLHIAVTTTDLFYEHHTSECRNLGALVRRTPEGVCLTTRSFATRQDDFDVVFPCLFLVGTGGPTSGDEHPIDAMVAALLPTVYQAGDNPWPGSYREDTCNEGFFRPEAGLVIVLLTDEDDHSDDTAAQAVLKLWQLQDGPVTLILFAPREECGAYSTPKLDALADLLPSHFAPICSDDYGAEFEKATETIRASCFYEPEG